jgi:hypothetical protein
MSVLGEGHLAGEEPGDIAQALLDARDQHARRHGWVLATEPVHTLVDYLQRAAAEIRCFRLSRELQHISRIRCLYGNEVLRAGHMDWVWEHLCWRQRINQRSLSGLFPRLPFGEDEREHRPQHPVGRQDPLAALHKGGVGPQRGTLDRADGGVRVADLLAKLGLGQRLARAKPEPEPPDGGAEQG